MAKLPSLTVPKLTSKTNSVSVLPDFAQHQNVLHRLLLKQKKYSKYLSRKEQQSCSVALNRSNSLLPIFSLLYVMNEKLTL